MWEITKSFEFDYGHRVWTQKLNPIFSIDSSCACRHLHGHRGKINISLSSDKLDDQGMVTDFKHLNFFKKFIDDYLDHKMILDINDPSLSLLLEKTEEEIVSNIKTVKNCYSSAIFYKDENYPIYFLKESSYYNKKREIKEIFEGMVFIDFVPTSENLAKFLFEIVKEKMVSLGVKVSKVEFYETPKSKSIYVG